MVAQREAESHGKYLFFLALSPEALFRVSGGDSGESYTLLHVLSELPIVLLALSVRLVVQARVGMLLW